jgi:hypothetical protein
VQQLHVWLGNCVFALQRQRRGNLLQLGVRLVVRLSGEDGLELDERAEAFDVIEMNACVSIQEEVALLSHRPRHLERVRHGVAQPRWICHRTHEVVARTRFGRVRAPVADQLGTTVAEVAKLQTGPGGGEEGVFLVEDAAVLGA